MNGIKILILFLFVILLSIQSGTAGNIINTADYPYWRQLAADSPFFAEMKASAIHTANNGIETRDVMGGCALAYILDPENKTVYIDKIKAKFETRITDMKIGNGAATSSVPSHELFYALLALDVIRYDLDSATLVSYESILKSKIMSLVIGKWDPHGWAMRMLWYKYIGEEDNFLNAKINFDIGLSEHYMANDGVSPAGTGYCVQRFNSIERAAKNTTLDIMEYMGYHEYYTNPGLIGLHEFMYGYATSPFGRVMLYGDSRNTHDQEAWTTEDTVIVSPTIVKSARFSPEAYQYAMWVLREGAGISSGILKGHLSNYLVMAGSAVNNNPLEFDTNDAAMAPSRLFKNFGALKSKEQSKDALYMSMQNLTGNTEYHTHYEVNALALSGYGEILMRNAGYNGPGKDVTIDGATATFEYMHSDSESSNNLMIGGKKHTAYVGEGITEGLIGQDVEYFRGSSTTAIEGSHDRDVVFVQPSDGANGYYLVMDHVLTDHAGDNVNIAWHPNAGILNIIKPETQYFSEIKQESGADGPHIFTENEAKLTTFLATPPATVEIKRTANQAREYTYAADYMYVNYDPVDKRKDILTVLFPGDKTHKTGDLSRIVAADYTGSKIAQGDIQDVAFTSSGATVGQYGTKTFQGEDVLFRMNSKRFISYFVKGVSFDDKKTRCGFEADQPIALYMNASEMDTGMRGIITSSGTKVTLYYPKISAVKLNEAAAVITASGSNWIQIQVPSGTFTVEIVSPHSL
ncbi:hypothetical protein N6H18_06590 [Reichenbachiella agarivorans]|uniref:Heparinase II/III-like protein n=1 Tax=Reichenbachiella agarivorans TaxID=2979464 RepID=A0ABY6CSX7_9BACT|nr:hypothetical protein [Reichenbachiella agarivorans]UXP33620.1 hypothetical protein N6H18_06590 [Reichenbachiella agarivorans]